MMSGDKGKQSSSPRRTRKSTKTRHRSASGAVVVGDTSRGGKRLRNIARPPLDSFDQFNRVRRSKKVLTRLTLPGRDQQTLLDADTAWAEFNKVYEEFRDQSEGILGKTLPQAVWDKLDACRQGMETLSQFYPEVRTLTREVGEIKQMQEKLKAWEEVLQEDMDTLAREGEQLVAKAGGAAAAPAAVTPVLSAEVGVIAAAAAVLAELATSPKEEVAHP